jgi:hypothetical protein
MPDEITSGTEPEAESSSVVHDDIMKRLLDYQRHLREGTSPAAAAEAATDERPMIDYAAAEAIGTQTETETLVDITAAEAQIEADTAPIAETGFETEISSLEAADAAVPEDAPSAAEQTWSETTPAAAGDLAARVAELERTIARVATMIGELRGGFQDMAVASDERLVAIEDELAAIGGSSGA